MQKYPAPALTRGIFWYDCANFNPPDDEIEKSMKDKGILYALGAYALWGILPVYWKALQRVPPIQILGHRVVWSFALLGVIILLRRESKSMIAVRASRRVLLLSALAAGLLGVNWLVYIWGVNSGHIVESSLGYFINPLVSVLLGVLFFKERLRPLQWTAVGLAAGGVIYLTIRSGTLPWISLVLALTFGFYGLLKKSSSLEALPGLSLEMAYSVPAGAGLSATGAKPGQRRLRPCRR